METALRGGFSLLAANVSKRRVVAFCIQHHRSIVKYRV